jgi:hypothetical protein
MDEVGLEPTNPKGADLQSAVIATRRFVLIKFRSRTYG